MPEAGIGAAEHRDATLANAGNVANRLLEIVRINIAAAADDHVLDAPAEVDLAVDEIGVIAAVEPVAVETSLRVSSGLR